MKSFLLTFVPLFFAVDAIGILPMFVGLTEGMEHKVRKKVLIESIITASVVAVAFLFAGQALFSYLGILVPDFMVAGGILLFIFSVRDLFTVAKGAQDADQDSIGAVPIGVPLIAGPAVLTTSLILANQQGYFITLVSLLINLLITGVLFWFSSGIFRYLGKSGSKAMSKIASIILAAIATMMVRKGVLEIIEVVSQLVYAVR
jgi:multiple antibiotic resistance protein